MRCAGRPRPFERLTKRKDFVAAASGRRFHTERMTVQGRLREKAEGTGAALRVGVTVTRKVGHAVERNRIKRRLRAAFGDAVAAGAAPSGDPALDVVLLARRPALSAPYDALVADVAASLGKVSRPGAPMDSRPHGTSRGNPKDASAPRRGRGRGHSNPSHNVADVSS
ncbi:MAG: ribonuclease P protein component [Salinarimonadaceae bacterium]|nr:MAG: ribonuclease P protein component [Salinarimonadaceae bacterium]